MEQEGNGVVGSPLLLPKVDNGQKHGVVDNYR